MQIFVIFDGRQFGPYTLDELRRQPITPHTPVWYAGLPDWISAGEAPATRVLFEVPNVEPTTAPPCDELPDPPYPVEDGTKLPDPPFPVEDSSELPEPPYPIENLDVQATDGDAAAKQGPDGQTLDPQGFNGDDANANTNGANANVGGYRRTPDSYMALSILMTVFCCLPFGIVACIKSANVSDCLAAGDYDGACRNSRAALAWIWVSLLSGLLFYFCFVFFGISLGAAATL